MTQAGGVALNLTAASHVILMDPWYVSDNLLRLVSLMLDGVFKKLFRVIMLLYYQCSSRVIFRGESRWQ